MTVTERAYAQDRDTREEAVQFAECAVHNGLGKAAEEKLTRGEVLKLKAQIERDYLLAVLARPLRGT